MISFKFPLIIVTVTFALLPACLHACPNPLPINGDIISPLGSSLTLCKKGNTHFLFTGGVGIPIYASTDLVSWKLSGHVFQIPTGAPWTAVYTGGDDMKLWAPDCKVVDGVVRYFYAASTLGSRNSAIFYAYSFTGANGNWTNGGLVLSSSFTDHFNAIDPNLSVDPVPYLSFDSYWSGIKGVQLNPRTFLTLSATYDSLAFRNNGVEPEGAPNSEEAPVVGNHGGFWYLFTSWNADQEDYQVHVARSTTYNGGYVGQAGVVALNNGGTLILASHNSEDKTSSSIAMEPYARVA
ncbi:Glycoside hydrolase family 43 [Mycena venus]|uniref:Endo-1,5-alpha-L-arabinanase A n=1 Tax=Mycena venus TaxID=2733690 RepID=A0A8H6YT11_9AGAR|nr:Glycoside hydrolase family 43 [Mycena venus]